MNENAAALRTSAKHVALVLALCLLFFFWRLGEVPFYTRGEPREGLVVWEMFKTGNWILPLINGDYIPFKPPLFHWVGVMAAKLFGGVDEFTVRFPSAFFGSLGVLLTYFFATRLWDETSGLIAAVVLATSPGWWRDAGAAQVDMTLAFFITAALVLFYFIYLERPPGKAKSLGLALLLALATLAKGPVGILVPSLAIFLFLWLRRDLIFLKELCPVESSLLFLCAAGSWYALALWQGADGFFFRQIIDENLLTAAGVRGHYQPIYYFLPVLFYHMLPWSLFFPALVFFLYRGRNSLPDEHLLFPLVWSVSVFLFFTLSLGKRGVYILPLYPALALLFGAWWRRLEKSEASFNWPVQWAGYLIGACCLLAVGGISIVLFRSSGPDDQVRPFVWHFGNLTAVLRSMAPPTPWVWASLALMGVAGFFLCVTVFKRKWNGAMISLAILMTAVVIGHKGFFSPFVASERSMKSFATRLNQKIDSQEPLLFYRSFDYGILFYSRRHIPPYSNQLAPPFFLLMWEEHWQRLSGLASLKRLDVSEGTGATGRHHLVLVESEGRLPVWQEPTADDGFDER